MSVKIPESPYFIDSEPILTCELHEQNLDFEFKTREPVSQIPVQVIQQNCHPKPAVNNDVFSMDSQKSHTTEGKIRRSKIKRR